MLRIRAHCRLLATLANLEGRVKAYGSLRLNASVGENDWLALRRVLVIHLETILYFFEVDDQRLVSSRVLKLNDFRVNREGCAETKVSHCHVKLRRKNVYRCCYVTAFRDQELVEPNLSTISRRNGQLS